MQQQPGEGARRKLLPLEQSFLWDTGIGGRSVQEFRSSIRCRRRKISKEQRSGSSRIRTGTKTGTRSNMEQEV